MYVYAFYAVSALTDSALSIALPEGIGSPLQQVVAGDLGAIAQPSMDLAALQQDEAALIAAVVRHDQILCHLVQTLTLLPLRFGTQFGSAAALRSHLQTQAETYRSQLQAIAGQAEFCLQFTLKRPDLEPTRPSPLTGREYFVAKKQRLAAQVEAEAEQQAQLVQLQRAIVQVYPHCQVDPQQSRLYLLIDRLQVDTLHQRRLAWETCFPSWQIQVSAALPPYHFV